MSKLDPRNEAQGHVPNGGLAGHSVGEIYPFALSFHPHPYGETGLWRVLDTRNGEYQTVHETAESAYVAALRHKQAEADEKASWEIYKRYCRADHPAAREKAQGDAPTDWDDLLTGLRQDGMLVNGFAPYKVDSPTPRLDLKITEEGPFTFFVSHASPPAVSLRTRLGPFKSQREAVIAAHGVLLRNLMHS